MPQLSELSEKDATADNNNEKTPATPVIQVKVGDILHYLRPRTFRHRRW